MGGHDGVIPRRACLGYRLADDGVQLVEDQGEQRILELIRELRADGMTLTAIADELNIQRHCEQT